MQSATEQSTQSFCKKFESERKGETNKMTAKQITGLLNSAAAISRKQWTILVASVDNEEPIYKKHETDFEGALRVLQRGYRNENVKLHEKHASKVLKRAYAQVVHEVDDLAFRFRNLLNTWTSGYIYSRPRMIVKVNLVKIFPGDSETLETVIEHWLERNQAAFEEQQSKKTSLQRFLAWVFSMVWSVLVWVVYYVLCIAIIVVGIPSITWALWQHYIARHENDMLPFDTRVLEKAKDIVRMLFRRWQKIDTEPEREGEPGVNATKKAGSKRQGTRTGKCY